MRSTSSFTCISMHQAVVSKQAGQMLKAIITGLRHFLQSLEEATESLSTGFEILLAEVE